MGLLVSNGAAQEKDDVAMRRVFVPVDDLDAVIGRDQRGVLLPKEEFLKLFRESKKNAPAKDAGRYSTLNKIEAVLPLAITLRM